MGETKFASTETRGRNTAIKVGSKDSKVELVSGAVLLLTDSAGMVLKGHFKSTHAKVQFTDASPVSFIEAQKGGNIELKGSRFEGTGNLSVRCLWCNYHRGLHVFLWQKCILVRGQGAGLVQMAKQ